MDKLVEAGYAVKLPPGQLEATAEALYVPHHMVQHKELSGVQLLFPVPGPQTQ